MNIKCIDEQNSLLMVTNKRKIQIWNIVKDNLINKRHRQLICNVISDLAREQIITIIEYSELANFITEYLKNNEHKLVAQNVRLLFEINDLQSRINWIDEQIKLLEK